MTRARLLLDEDGAAMVTVALALPVLLLFAAFVIDVGDWFEQQRHLQLQADAGALAAAGDLRYPCSGEDDERVEERAREYSGTGGESGGYNHQVGGTPSSDVLFALNSRTYPRQSRVDPTVVAAPPCEAGMVDVKLTETDRPLLLRVASLFTSVPFINAHARVQVFEQEALSQALPVAVPDPNPRKARVTFVDEEGGQVLGSGELSPGGSEEAGPERLAIWDDEAEPISLTVGEGTKRIGVRVALGGSTSTSCGDPLVACYDAGSPGGILFVRGFSMAGSGAQPGPPLARGAYLEPGTCPDPYFSAGGCSVGLRAVVDFGPCEDIGRVGAQLTAVAGGNKYPLQPEPGGCPAGTSTGKWKTSGAPIPVPAEAGPVPISLEWAETKGAEGGNACREGGGNKCTGSFGAVQRSFAASSARSGPIRLAHVAEGSEIWANSLERCSAVQASCTYPVSVRIGIAQNLQENATDVQAPPVALRVFQEAENNPSQNQALDCDPALPNLRQEIANGCAPEYARNRGTACPAPSQLWASPQPWRCTALQTGGDVNQVFQGMNERVFGTASPSSCTGPGGFGPNQWASFPDLAYGEDPRIVPVFLTAFGSFGGSGNGTVPVTDFATFYVTGWAGRGAGNSSQSICPGDDPAEAGTIVGHFIKYVDALNEGGAGEERCDFSSLTPCEAVLTE